MVRYYVSWQPENLWGNYLQPPSVHYDPFQSFIDKNYLIGFKVVISPSRRQRPREQSPSASDVEIPYNEQNILTQVYKGTSAAIVVSTEESTINDPFSKNVLPEYHNWEDHKAISIVNKFSIFSRIPNINNYGIMIVSFATTPIQYPRDKKGAMGWILLSMKHALNICFQRIKGQQQLVTFFNIGSNSGASLHHLHGQIYVNQEQTRNFGSTEYMFMKSYEYHLTHGSCYACNHFKTHYKTNEITNSINIKNRIVWEDTNVMLIAPHAPIREGQLRIIPRTHASNIANFSDSCLHSIGNALEIADTLMYELLKGRSFKNDRSIIFRQFIKDFHMIIDILPVYAGFGGAELIVPLSIGIHSPSQIAERYRNILTNLKIIRTETKE